MVNIAMHFKKHFMWYVFLPLLILAAASSYYRFMIQTDYMVSYEGPCDESTQNCYADCDDEECTSEYYFSTITRHANDIYALCGNDVLDCEAAESCPPEESTCSITFCDLETESEQCETIGLENSL